MIVILPLIGMVVFVIWLLFFMKKDCPVCKQKENTIIEEPLGVLRGNNIYKCGKCGSEFIIP